MIYKTFLAFCTIAFVFLAAACTKDDPVPEPTILSYTAPQPAIGWGLNRVLTESLGDKPGDVWCVRCGVGCDCFDFFTVVGMTDTDLSNLTELTQAIDDGEVAVYFNDPDNAGKWESLFQGAMQGEVLQDLQDGLTTLMWFSDEDEEQISIAITYADGSDHPGY